MKLAYSLLSITIALLMLWSFYFNYTPSKDITPKEMQKKEVNYQLSEVREEKQQTLSLTKKIKKRDYNIEQQSIEKLYTLINNKNYSELEQFHHANLLCSSTIRYDSQYDYILDNPSLSIKEAEKIFNDCSKVKIKEFNDLRKIYKNAIDNGVKMGEFMLAITYPPLFEEHYQYLSQATSWKEDSLHLLNQSLAAIEGVSDDKKLFWAKVFQDIYPEKQSLLVDNISYYESNIDPLLSESIINSALLWANSSSETEKRAIVTQLNENL